MTRDKMKKLIEDTIVRNTTVDYVDIDDCTEEIIKIWEFGHTWETNTLSEYEYLKGLEDRLREILNRKDIDGFQKEVRIRELLGE